MLLNRKRAWVAGESGHGPGLYLSTIAEINFFIDATESQFLSLIII
jgi:hypothetical protein